MDHEDGFAAKIMQPCTQYPPSVELPQGGLENRYLFSFSGMEDATMPRVKQASQRKRVTKAAVPALGAAGLTFGLMGGASATTTPAFDAPQKLDFSPAHAVTLGEEEIADVSLATFHLFDKENAGGAQVQVAWGCGGCRGCRCGGCRGCRCGGGCRCGCGGCGGCGSCCLSWGACRLC
jgi:hypothetical protein